MAQTARNELKAELGDTVGDFDLADLNPRTFVRKHLLDDIEPDRAPATRPVGRPRRSGGRLHREFGRPADAIRRRRHLIRSIARVGTLPPPPSAALTPVRFAAPIDHKSSACPDCLPGRPWSRRSRRSPDAPERGDR